MVDNGENCEENNKNYIRKVSDTYRFLIELGSGSFGSVWKIKDKIKNKEYAIKIENKTEKSRLKNEYFIYKDLVKEKILFGIPRIKKYFESKNRSYMVMQLLGNSLDQMLEIYDFDIMSVLKLAIQIIVLLEKIHNAGYLHRDIKPNNFLIGTDIDNDSIFIMDFGLSKKYITENNEHAEMKFNKSTIGTARYISINVHDGYEPSRRDDLESVGYVLIYLLNRKLPWQGLKKNKSQEHIKTIGDCKKNTSIEELCGGQPYCFEEYIKYCRNLKYDETPDYNYLKKLFYAKSKELGGKLKYFWE